MARRIAVLALLLAGCNKGGGHPGLFDLSSLHDLGGFDFTHPAADFAGSDVDLQTSPDLAMGNCADVVINEVQTGGNGGATDEFIELYSPCGVDVSLDGWVLEYESAAGTMPQVLVTFSGMTIPAGKPYLVAGNKGYTGLSDVTYSAGSLAQAGGSVGLVAPTQNRVDSVGWGTATNTLVEGSPAMAPPTASSIERLPNGSDNNDNSKDFMVTNSPTPGALNQ
jgi:hypothetical protein